MRRLTGHSRTPSFIIIFSAALFIGVAQTCLGETLRVPGEYVNIRAAMNAAQHGDVILLADGVYSGAGNRDINFAGKRVTVASENGSEACTIDCEDLGRAFILDSGETHAATIEGLTITNGYTGTGNGGAIDITLQSNATIRNCRFLNNFAYALGGAIAARGGSRPIIERCEFRGNVASGYVDGAYGGAISCFILSNATITDCLFVNNVADFGGALDCGISNSTVINCLMINNVARIAGGAIEMSGSEPRFINCTVARNSAPRGGGIALIGAILESHPTILNSIVYDNSPEEMFVGLGSVTARYSNLGSGFPGHGNIDADPRFSAPGDEGFELLPGSPCTDAANNTFVPGRISFDLNGDPRFVDDPDTRDTGVGDPPIVDMGCYEFQLDSNPPMLTIDPDPLISGTEAQFTATNMMPNAFAFLAYSTRGPGATFIPELNVTLDIDRPRQAGTEKRTDAEGRVQWILAVPSNTAGIHVWLQVAQFENKTNLVDSVIQ